jgi:predicted nucleotidyltransferase
MIKKRPAETILFPHARQQVLARLLLHPKREWYLSELARALRVAPAHLHRELALLVEAGVLRRRVEGRQVYYSPDSDCPYLSELTSLVRKTMGFEIVLAEALRPLRSKIDCAFIYGSVAKGGEKSTSDVDLMVVGDVTIAELVPALDRAERELGRPVNPTVYPKRELVRKLREGHHFVGAVFADPVKQFVIGTRHDLEKAARGQADQEARSEQGRARRAARRRRG